MRPGEKLLFYATLNVNEYLEIDLSGRSARLLGNRGGVWTPVAASSVITLTIDEVVELLPAQ